MSQSPTQNPQIERNQGHVPKIKTGLQKSVHLGLDHEIINPIEEHVKTHAGTAEEGVPLPVVILGIEAEIGGNDGGHADDNDEDGVHAQHESIDVVELVVPEGGEDVVELDEDGSKGKNSAEWNEVERLAIPGGVRYGPRYGVDATGKRVGFGGESLGEIGVPAEEGSEDAEGHGYKYPEKK